MLESVLSQSHRARRWITVIALSVGFQMIADGADVEFERHVINADTDYSAAAVIDVNHDGKLDIVCGGDWYEAPDWKRHFVRDVPRIRDRPDGFAHLTLDVNRDGWTDIITVNYRSSSIKWVQHPGTTFGPWTTHIVVEPGPMETGRLVDIDGDGQVDLLPNGARFAAWFEMVWDSDAETSVPKWIRHDLPAEAGGHGLGFGDIDGDGRGDIVGQFGWLKAPDQPRTERWRWNPEFHLERASIPMIVVDVDDDGDSDIVWTSAHGFGCYWLEQTRTAGQVRSWIRHAIDTSWSQAHAPLWIDLDGDGRNEFVAGKRYMSHGGADPGAYDPMTFYRYQFDPKSRAWQRRTISSGEGVGAGLDPKAADMDGDGDLDLVVSGRSGLYLLENLGATNAGRRETLVPQYGDHLDLFVVKDRVGRSRPVANAADWGERRAHITASIEDSLGRLPGVVDRVPLDIQVEAETVAKEAIRRRISYQVDARHRVTANLTIPKVAAIGVTPAVLCAFKAPRAAESRRITKELAERGYVCIVPGEPRSSDTMTAIWDAMRAIDVLQALAEVHGERIGVLGDALEGRLAMVLAALDQRVIATIAEGVGRVPETGEATAFSTGELIASVAPRSIWIQATGNERLDGQLKDAASRAAAIFDLRDVASNLHAVNSQRDAVARSDPGGAYEWLDGRLKRTRRPGRRRRSD